MNQQENNNTDIQTRSNFWKNVFKTEKELNSLYEKAIDIAKKSETAQNIGDISKLQECSKQQGELGTEIFIKQMKMQKVFIELTHLKEYQEINFYNN